MGPRYGRSRRPLATDLRRCGTCRGREDPHRGRGSVHRVHRSKSFRDVGLWAPALAAKPNYVLIQFGHNDAPGKGPERETDPKTTYREYMSRYIDESRAVGAEPVLVTSIVRRNFTPQGKIAIDSLPPFVAEVRLLAMKKRVPSSISTP